MTIEEAREISGEEVESLTEKQITEILSTAELLVELSLDVFQQAQFKKKGRR